MTGKCSAFTKPSYLSRIVAGKQSPLTCSASSCSGATQSTKHPLSLCAGASLANVRYSSFLALHKGIIWWWLGCVWRIEKRKIREREQKWKFDVETPTLFAVKMIQIWTFQAAPSTERVPSLAEQVAYLKYSINLRLFNWRVPALVKRVPKSA